MSWNPSIYQNTFDAPFRFGAYCFFEEELLRHIWGNIPAPLLFSW